MAARKGTDRKRSREWQRSLWGLLLPVLFALTPDLPAQSFNWGGSVRAYQFFRVEDLPETPFNLRRDTEFGSFRFTLTTKFHPRVKWETHAVLDFLSPRLSGAGSLVAGENAAYLPLEHEFSDSTSYTLLGRFDRLNLQLDFDSVRVVVGRQAISWGVTYFWPAIDLFSSFAPQRIDRDFKEGVDAIRVTVPLGKYSEVEVIGAGLGSSLSDDGAAAAQARIYLGRLDIGLIAGKFHRDTVAGAFFTAGVRGIAYRGEVAWTLSGDPHDRRLDRRQFWRASFGIDRQLSPEVTATLEFSYNGYGVGSPSQYRLLAQSDRVQRGEVSALGTYYTGMAVSWQIHPLWTMTQTVLVNWQDPSVFWIPALQWSTSDNSTLLFAAQSGFGGGLNPDLSLRSEYGPVPTTLFAAVKWYF